MSKSGIWTRLDQELSLVTRRPKLVSNVRIRNIGDEFELVQSGTRRVIPIESSDVEVLRRFDGTQSIAEIIVLGIQEGVLTVEPVASLVDKLVRAEMLEQYPPHFYRQIKNHFHSLGVDLEPISVANSEPESNQSEEKESLAEHEPDVSGPWRARSPEIADLARFLRGVTLLAELDVQTIGKLADLAHVERWQPSSFIVSEGGRGDRFFIVLSGSVQVQRRSDDLQESLAKLGPGDWFGEAALVEGVPRNATVRASGDRAVQVISFDNDVFSRFIKPYVQMRDGRGSVLVGRRRAQLEKVPLFGALASADLDRIARSLRETRAAKGTIIFRQGELGNRFYVIISGSVGVVKDGRPIAKLTEGEFFGETALLFTETRTATVAATEDSRFWVLDREDFHTFIRDALLHRRDLIPTVFNRISSSDPV